MTGLIGLPTPPVPVPASVDPRNPITAIAPDRVARLRAMADANPELADDFYTLFQIEEAAARAVQVDGQSEYQAAQVRGDLLRRRIKAEADKLWHAERYPFSAQLAPTGFGSAAADYDAVMGARREMLVAGWIPANSDVALGAQYKAGKTFLITDLAASITSGTPFLGEFPVTRAGRVAAMVNEGSPAEFYQRLTAVARAKGVDVRRDVLPRLWRQFGASTLSDPEALATMAEQLAQFAPDVIVVDPWYLSAGDADGRVLSTTGAVLRGLSGVARSLSAALVITTHWNKTGSGSGFDRWSGSGLQEWGRVLINVDASTTGQAPYSQDRTQRSHVVNRIEVRGEVAGSYEVTRDVWRDDARDLNSTMHYEVTAAEVDAARAAATEMTPAEKKQRADEQKHDMIMYRVLEFIGVNAIAPPTERAILKGKLGEGAGTSVARKDALELATNNGWICHAGEAAALRSGKVVDPADKTDDTKIVGHSRLALTSAGQNARRELAARLDPLKRFTGVSALVPVTVPEGAGQLSVSSAHMP